jgi:hypothetical protein
MHRQESRRRRKGRERGGLSDPRRNNATEEGLDSEDTAAPAEPTAIGRARGGGIEGGEARSSTFAPRRRHGHGDRGPAGGGRRRRLMLLLLHHHLRCHTPTEGTGRITVLRRARAASWSSAGPAHGRRSAPEKAGRQTSRPWHGRARAGVPSDRGETGGEERDGGRASTGRRDRRLGRCVG